MKSNFVVNSDTGLVSVRCLGGAFPLMRHVAPGIGALLVGILGGGCSRPAPPEPPPAAVPRKIGLEGLTLPLRIEGAVDLKGKARIGRAYPRPVREGRFSLIPHTVLCMEGVTVTTNGSDVRILSALRSSLPWFRELKEFEIRGLRVIGPEDAALLECAEARAKGDGIWELRGVRNPAGGFFPRAELHFKVSAGEPVMPRVPLKRAKAAAHPVEDGGNKENDETKSLP